MQRYLLVTVLALLVGLSLAAPSIADEDEIFEFKRLDTIKISLGQAIEIAERDGKGKAVKAEFDIEHDHALWEIKIFSGVALREYEIDTESGQIAKVEDERVEQRLYSTVMAARFKGIEAAKTSAIEAVTVAEQQTAAKAIFLEVEREYGRAGQFEYEIILRSEDKRLWVRIDAATGHIVSGQ